MRPVTLTDLAELTGKTWRTVRKRLQDAGIQPVDRTGNSDLFASDDALVAILLEPDGGEGLDLTAERARLASAQAEKVEMENAVRRGELADVNDVGRVWSNHIAAARAKLLAMPTSLAPRLAEETDPADVQRIIRESIHRALSELGDYEPAAEEST